MVWALVFVLFVAAAVYAAHRLLTGVDALGAIGNAGLLPRALVYAAAVVVGSQATDAAISIRQLTSRDLGLSSGDKTQATIQLIASHLADAAWQAGLLLAAAALVASVSGRRTRPAD